MGDVRRGGRIGAVAIHAARVGVVAALAWLVHADHARLAVRQAAADVAEVPVARVQRWLPDATGIGGDSTAVAGARDVVGAGGERLGTVLRTSPAGDRAIGFSGPTDVLVVCTADLRVAGVEILSSRDTRDHVAAIVRDESFLASFTGKPLADLAGAAPADAVAGSTLSCLAIRDALALRLGGSAGTSRFATAPTLDDLRKLFPDAATIEPDAGDAAVIRVGGTGGTPLGWVLRTSPAADGVIGYQGPTDAAVGFDPQGLVRGVLVLASYDNEPYVGYVRDDRAFRGVYRGMTLEQLAGVDPAATGVEGVSGATMTSQAVAAGIVRAARARADRATAAPAAGLAGALRRIEPPQWGAIAIVATGIVTAFTRLKGTWFGRWALPVAVLAYLGFGAGALVSQAQLWGWAEAGVPRGAVVLAVLAIAALALPVTTRRNVYCSHLCAHGAAQQLLVRFARPRRSVPRAVAPWLAALPWALLATCILATVLRLPLALVDLEPFDAYLPAVAGTAALAIFAVSLAASGLWPMAYCRHGCPTGALLDHLRFHRRADRLTWRDAVLVVCLGVAVLVHWSGS